MKIIGIHQPNYLPWMGYFYKILKSDIFVILDNVDYQSGNANSITNRCRIKGPNGIVILTAPVKHNTDYKWINQQYIDYSRNWQMKHKRAVENYYRKSPWFSQYYPQLEQIWDSKFDRLSELNFGFIKLVCQFLDIQTPLLEASSLPPQKGNKSDRIIDICIQLKADIYLSGNGARKYNDIDSFKKNKIELVYTGFKPVEYPQQYDNFIPGLSILDALFNIGPDVKQLIN